MRIRGEGREGTQRRYGDRECEMLLQSFDFYLLMVKAVGQLSCVLGLFPV